MSENKNQNKTMMQVVSGAVCAIVMMLCVIIYIALGVTKNFWHPGWIIVAGGGIACGIVSVVFNTIEDVKRIKKEEKKED